MANLIDLIGEEAVTLADQDLPSSEQVRSYLGALIKRVGRLEQKVTGSDELEPAPAVEPPKQPTPLEQAENELAAAQAKVKALELQASSSTEDSSQG